MKTGYGNAQKSSLHPTDRPKPCLVHEMPAVAQAPRFGAHSAAVYNDEIETWHFADVQAACTHVTLAIARNFIHRSKRLYDGNGESEAYLVQLQTNRVLLCEDYRELACFPCKAEAVLMRNAAFAVQPLPLISGIPT